MNKLTLLIIVITSTINILNCQQPKRGIGFEFHTFPNTFLIGETGSSMGVYFPFETATGLFIEPLITYRSSSSEIDYDDYNNNDYDFSSVSWGISLGIFNSTYLNKIRTYMGIRIGKIWTVEEETGYDDDETDAWIISPTFGAEYFINENFSFGGEVMYSMLSSEEEGDGYDNSYTKTTKISMIIPKFMVRFYF